MRRMEENAELMQTKLSKMETERDATMQKLTEVLSRPFSLYSKSLSLSLSLSLSFSLFFFIHSLSFLILFSFRFTSQIGREEEQCKAQIQTMDEEKQILQRQIVSLEGERDGALHKLQEVRFIFIHFTPLLLLFQHFLSTTPFFIYFLYVADLFLTFRMFIRIGKANQSKQSCEVRKLLSPKRTLHTHQHQHQHQH